MRATLLSILLVLTVADVRPEDPERYYMTIFATEGPTGRPRESHTFAVFTKADGKGGWESHTISWVPATLTVVPLRPTPEPGRNLTLAETLAWTRGFNARVTAWGPSRIDKAFFDRGLRQIERLQSGKVAYIAIDRRFPINEAINCIHAVSDLDEERPRLDTGLAHGEPATHMVARHLQKRIIPSEEKRDELLGHLELKPAQVRFVSLARESE